MKINTGKYLLNQPLITIGITAFNVEDTIVDAVTSALSQSWRPIEIIIVDDCSTDSTYIKLKKLIVFHTEVSVFQNRINGGVAVSRNRILEEAKGVFVVFFDDDDQSLPERLTSQYNRIRSYERGFANGSMVICHTARELIYPDGQKCIEHTMGETREKIAPNGLDVANRILLGTPLEDGYGACPTCSQMARLSTYQKIDGFDGAFRRSEDTELNIRLAKKGCHFVGISRPLVLQKMTKTTDKSLADEHHYMRKLLKKHRDVVDKHNMYDFCGKWIDIKYAWLEKRRLWFGLLFLKLLLLHPLLVSCRVFSALPNFETNRSFSRFHQQGYS